MGIFRRRPTIDRELRAWMDSTTKLRGLCDEVLKRRGVDAAVMVLAHFADTLSATVEALAAAGVDSEPWSRVVDRLMSPAGDQRGLVAAAYTTASDSSRT